MDANELQKARKQFSWINYICNIANLHCQVGDAVIRLVNQVRGAELNRKCDYFRYCADDRGTAVLLIEKYDVYSINVLITIV